MLNEGLKKMGAHAFTGCTSLESIDLPSTVIKICVNAFYGCRNLLEVVLNEGLQEIDANAGYT